MTIGLHQSWWPQNKSEGQPPALPDFTDDELEKIMATMYLVAIGWSQWSGANVSRVGPYALMVFGVFVSVCAGALASAFPSHVYCVYAVRALQGFGSASLAVAVPEYIMTSNTNVTGPFQSEYLLNRSDITNFGKIKSNREKKFTIFRKISSWVCKIYSIVRT